MLVGAVAGFFGGWNTTLSKPKSAPAVVGLLEPDTNTAAGKLLKERLDDFVPLVIAETGCTATVGRAMQDVAHRRAERGGACRPQRGGRDRRKPVARLR